MAMKLILRCGEGHNVLQVYLVADLNARNSQISNNLNK
jgi:hypothetical protein